ncbi:hypothetical protein C8J31_10223 [Rhizobium sp. PP-CC-2G-626]|nr:hypothetical protein C8J31_10223 [Rhizobium sp. PP-CC-2G-626]
MGNMPSPKTRWHVSRTVALIETCHFLSKVDSAHDATEDGVFGEAPALSRSRHPEPFRACGVGKRFTIFRNRETRCHGIAVLVNKIIDELGPARPRLGSIPPDLAGCEGMTTMRSHDIETQAAPATLEGSELEFTMEMLELELSLDGTAPDGDDFSDRVRAAAADLKGAFLFDLPASGLIENCERIAVLRIPRDSGTGSETIFACLEVDGTSIRIEKPNERTMGLASFAQAFVDVFQRM